MMTLTEINDRLNTLAAAMVAKGMKTPEADCSFRANNAPNVHLSWDKDRTTGSYADRKYRFFLDDDIAAAFTEAEAFVASQPDADQRRLHEFMGALGSVIDLGRENHIDVEFLNPLIATAKNLAENAITHQPAQP